MKNWLIITLCFCSLCFANEAPKKALIFGVTGQDGSYLAEYLLEKGYQVHGARRRTSTFNTARIEHIYQNRQVHQKQLFLHYAELSDAASIIQVINTVQPDEIYNLAGESHEKISFDMPEHTCNINALGTLRILEAIRTSGRADQIRFFNATSNHIFGSTAEIPQTEQTPMHPTSPYGTSKLFAYWITINYREAYGMYTCNGIMFNHASPMRNGIFATRKITHAIGKIIRGQKKTLYLGNLDAMRDWGFAKDYVSAIHSSLQQDKPDDYVIATGESHSVREFVELAFKEAGINLKWEGKGLNEKGINIANGETIVAIDPFYLRPREINCSLGDASKAEKNLHWKATTSFNDLIKIMVQADLSGQNPR